MNWAKIEEITYAECDNPHELLGPHKQGSKMLVQAFFPGAEKVTIHWKKTGQVGEAFLADVPMELADEEGYFAALVNAGKMAPYEYVVEYGKTEEREAHRMICGDAYRHVPQITKEDMDRFAAGIHYTIYEKLGAHPMELDVDAFLAAIEEHFMIEKKGRIPYRPEKKGAFGMFLEDEWYCLTAKKEIRSEDAVEGLDVSLLQNYLLNPVLGIEDPKTDKRIDFVGGIRGLAELERRVHTDMKVAFSMYPTSIGELFAVADAGRLMPPKSTWFEPKLRSGLFLHEIER